MKILNKRVLQQIAFNHLLDINFKDFNSLQKIILKNHTFSQSLILLLYLIILYVLDIIF